MNQKAIIALLSALTCSLLLSGCKEKNIAGQTAGNEIQNEYELLKKQNADLLQQVKVLKELLRKSELNRYNTIAYSNAHDWPIEELIQNSSLILLKSLSNDGEEITTEVLKKGKDVLFDPNEAWGDETHRVEDLKQMGFQADLMFYGENPPTMIFGVPVKDGRILYIPGEPLTLKKLREMVKAHDGK